MNVIKRGRPIGRSFFGVCRQPVIALLSAILLSLTAPNSRAISFGQIDTFQDGTTMNWQEGINSPNPPTNIATGGPAGAGDRFLEDVSTGGFGAGSKLVMFNEVQWTGNYVAAGIDRITTQMANLGSTTLHMRIAIRGGPTSTAYGSTTATDLPPDGVWRVVTFDLTNSALTSIGGADTLAQVLANVNDVRILSAIGGPSFQGDPIQATLGIDNILGRDIANFILRITNLAFVNGAPQISFTTIANRSHQVQFRNALTGTDWTVLSNATNITGTGNIMQISDPQPGADSMPMRFYRVVLLPP